MYSGHKLSSVKSVFILFKQTPPLSSKAQSIQELQKYLILSFSGTISIPNLSASLQDFTTNK